MKNYIITTSQNTPLSAFHSGDIIRKTSDLKKIFPRSWNQYNVYKSKEEAQNKINYMLIESKKQNADNRWGDDGVEIALNFINRLQIKEIY